VVDLLAAPIPPEGGGGGGGQPRFPTDLDYACDLSPVDWLLAQSSVESRNVTIYDYRREAALATQYLVLWGDGGLGTESTTTPVSHTYAEPEKYVVTVRVVYQTGAIDIFTTYVDVRGNNCAVHSFAQDILPVVVLTAGLAFIAAFIVLATRRATEIIRIGKAMRVRLGRWLLLVAAILVGFVIVFYIYAAAAGIPT